MQLLFSEWHSGDGKTIGTEITSVVVRHYDGQRSITKGAERTFLDS
jgi:hypothetical protein